MTDIQSLATQLDEAVTSATAIAQLTDAEPLTLAQAYAVQAAGVALRSERGDRPVGVKLGFTSKAKAIQMGVDDVIVGIITESMSVPDGGVLDVGRHVHPRIEPEVAFRLARDIDVNDPDDDPLTAIDAVAPALEIIDSRYRDFKFSLEDVVADNTSAAAFVVGEWQSLESVDIADAAVTLSVDGTAAETGSTSDILGHPAEALPAVKRMAALHGLALRAGDILLAGAATAAIPLLPGVHVTAAVDGLGGVSLSTVAAS